MQLLVVLVFVYRVPGDLNDRIYPLWSMLADWQSGIVRQVLTLPGAALAAKNDAKINVACMLVWIILLDLRGYTHEAQNMPSHFSFRYFDSLFRPGMYQHCFSIVL